MWKELRDRKRVKVRRAAETFSRTEFRKKGEKVKTTILRVDYSVLKSKGWRDQRVWESCSGDKKLRG